jgi:hypothetical protein
MEEYTEDGLKKATSILCIVDFSQSSERALSWAICLAKQINAHLIILHAFRLLLQEGNPVQLAKAQSEKAFINFHIIEKRFFQSCQITYEFKAEIGFIVDRIEAHSSDRTIDLLVVDKKQESGVFDEIFQRVKIPIAIIS